MKQFRNHLPYVLLATLYITAVPSALALCSTPTTPDCLYESPVTYNAPPTATQTLSYLDITSHQRELHIVMRIPQGAPEPMPVVIWSHGGSAGKTNPNNSLVEWSEATAAAGYLTISIAHPGRPSPAGGGTKDDLCVALGFTVGSYECDNFKHLNWDRPFDILRVLVELEAQAQSPAWLNRIDLAKIGIGGHSAGSGGALTAAGAVRNIHGFVLDFPDYVAQNYPQTSYPAPTAVLAFSPQGPGSEGFFETDYQQPDTSWDSLDLPVLIGTGDGDNSCTTLAECVRGDSPSGRRAVFDLMPAGTGKYRLYINNIDAYHNMYTLNRSKCDPNGPVAAQDCDDFVQWLKSAGLAFLDAKLRGLQGAIDWLDSDNLPNGADLTQSGVVEWDRK